MRKALEEERRKRKLKSC